MLWADRTTVKRTTGMSPAKMMLGEEHVLPIELKLTTWQNLPWTSVKSTSQLLLLRAQQLDKREDDLKEAAARQERMREEANDFWESTYMVRRRQEALEDG